MKAKPKNQEDMKNKQKTIAKRGPEDLFLLLRFNLLILGDLCLSRLAPKPHLSHLLFAFVPSRQKK